MGDSSSDGTIAFYLWKEQNGNVYILDSEFKIDTVLVVKDREKVFSIGELKVLDVLKKSNLLYPLDSKEEAIELVCFEAL